MFTFIQFKSLFSKQVLFSFLFLLVFSLASRAQWKETDGPFGYKVNAVAELQDGRIIIGVYNTGMFRSADQGQTWELINDGLEVYYDYDTSGQQTFTALGLGVSPNGTIFMGNYNGMWRSTDNGDTWTKQNIDLGYPYIFGFIFPSEDLIYATTQGGIFTSIDNGDTWVKMESYTGGGEHLFLMDDGTLFASVQANTGLYRSTDEGETWEGILMSSIYSYPFGMEKTSDGTIYAATNGKGIIYSTDNGDSWGFLNMGIENLFLRALEITADDDLFAGDTQGNIYRLKQGEMEWELVYKLPDWFEIYSIHYSSDSRLYVASDEGMLLASDDFGDTWESVSPRFPNTEVNRLFTAPNGSIFAFSQANGIYRTDDRGKLWVKSHSGIEGRRPEAFTVSPEGMLFASGGSGPFKSEDNGENWVSINTGIKNIDLSLMAAASNDVIFGFRNVHSGIEVYRTTDGGDLWQGVTSISKGSANDVLFTPAGDVFVSTNQGVFYSNDNGDTWTERTNGMSVKFSRALAMASDGTIYAGMAQQGGVYSSTDNGENWMPTSNGLTTTTVFDLTVDEDDIVYAATYGGGIFKLDLDTTTWSSLNIDLNKPYMISIAATSDGYLFAGGLRNSVFSYRLNTPVWTKVTTGLGNSVPRNLLVMPEGDLYLTTHQGLYISTDNGDNWTATANNGLDQKNIFSVAQAADGSFIAGMFTYNQTLVYRSTDAGDNWTAIADGIEGRVNTFHTFPGGKLVAGTETGIYSLNGANDGWTKMETPKTRIMSFATPPAGDTFVIAWGDLFKSTDRGGSWTLLPVKGSDYAEELAIGINNTVYMATWGGMYHSLDDGETWSIANNNGLPKLGLDNVLATDDGAIYTALGIDGHGVFVSHDNGNNWESFGIGLPSFGVNGKLFTSPNGYLFYVAGYDVWRYPFDAEMVTSIEDENPDMVSEFKLEQNYPNPFNPVTTIGFTLPNTADVSLKIYDVMGREVATLVSDKLTAGSHSFQWNASNLASGVYFYRLKAGSFTATKRLTLIK